MVESFAIWQQSWVPVSQTVALLKRPGRPCRKLVRTQGTWVRSLLSRVYTIQCGEESDINYGMGNKVPAEVKAAEFLVRELAPTAQRQHILNRHSK